MFEHVKAGDKVGRTLGYLKPMELTVSKVEDGVIYAGMAGVDDKWMFDANTGWEIDLELESGPEYGTTVSYISSINGKRCNAEVKLMPVEEIVARKLHRLVVGQDETVD